MTRKETRDKLIETVEHKALLLLHAIGVRSNDPLDKDRAAAVFSLIQIRAALIAEAETLGDEL